jgi:hypothetical protein
VIIDPTACFHVRLGFHSYLLLWLWLKLREPSLFALTR